MEDYLGSVLEPRAGRAVAATFRALRYRSTMDFGEPMNLECVHALRPPIQGALPRDVFEFQLGRVPLFYASVRCLSLINQRCQGFFLCFFKIKSNPCRISWLIDTSRRAANFFSAPIWRA